jgi:hypothetical protein
MDRINKKNQIYKTEGEVQFIRLTLFKSHVTIFHATKLRNYSINSLTLFSKEMFTTYVLYYNTDKSLLLKSKINPPQSVIK